MSEWPLDFPKNVRIDCGPQTRVGIATEAFLTSGQIAAHYEVGKPDALGVPIAADKKFHYVDWKAPPEDFIFTVYQMRGEDGKPAAREFDDDGDRIARYVVIERYPTEAKAVKAAQKLAGAK